MPRAVFAETAASDKFSLGSVAMEARAKLARPNEERPAISKTVPRPDHLCCICHAVPRYRRNSRTCRSEACRGTWLRQRTARNAHAYRVRKSGDAGGRLVEDPALLVELAARAKRSVSENPVTPLYGYYPSLTDHSKYKDKDKHKYYSEGDEYSTEGDPPIRLGIGKKTSRNLLQTKIDASRYQESVYSDLKNTRPHLLQVRDYHFLYPLVCDARLDSHRPLRHRVEQLVYEASRLARERTRDCDYGGAVHCRARGAGCLLLGIGEDLLQLALLIVRRNKTLLNRLGPLQPDLIFRLACTLHKVSESLGEVCDSDKFWRWRGWDAKTTIAWNSEHPGRGTILPYAVTPLALVIDPHCATLFENAGRALYRLIQPDPTCDECHKQVKQVVRVSGESLCPACFDSLRERLEKRPVVVHKSPTVSPGPPIMEPDAAYPAPPVWEPVTESAIEVWCAFRGFARGAIQPPECPIRVCASATPRVSPFELTVPLATGPPVDRVDHRVFPHAN
jgi:hypothetical protein